MAEESKTSPRWPITVALLNLTGLGLGYLYMKRWRRWLVHFLVTVVLVTVASLTNAASIPGLWVLILGVWLLWMAIDGWLQARRLMRGVPIEAMGQRRLPIAGAVFLLVLTVAGLWGYGALGRREFAAGMAAYRAADCRTAIRHFDRVTTLYELTLSPNVATANAGIIECSLLVFPENARERASESEGGYADAVDGYRAYLDLYAESELTTFARDMLAETYGDWAAHLRRSGDYQTAIEKYQIVADDYPKTPTGQVASASIAETYADWATQLREAGKYGQAVDKHLIVINEYPDTPTGEQAAALAAETYVEWATHLREDGEFGESVERYQIVLSEYVDTPAAADVAESAVETYFEWAVQLREAGEYEAAVEKYQAILSEYPATTTAAGVREPAAEAYVEWAAQLQEAGDYEEAVGKYQFILDEYADTSAAVGAEEAAAKAYAEWAMQCRELGHYSVAVGKYTTILDEYPDTEPASTAQTAIAETYNDWGRHLHSQRAYIEAMDKFTLTKEATDDPKVIAAAEEGYDEALLGLSQDSSGEGKQVMEQALPGVCEGEPAESPAVGLAEDEPGKALFGGSEFGLPHDLKATQPGHFRYVVCLESGTSVLQRCPYTAGHTLVRQRKWWRVRVRDTRTARVVADRTFNGSSPPACPFSRMFWSTTDYSTGNSPSSDQVIDWLQGVVR